MSITGPAVQGGSKRRTHTVTLQRDRVRISPTSASLALFAGIAAAGLLSLLVGVFELITGGDGDSGYLALLGSIALPVGAIPVYRAHGHDLLLRDKSVWKKPLWRQSTQIPGTVQGIQIVAKSVRGVDTAKPFLSCEMNALLVDGERHNLLQHGNIKRIREDARQAADPLGVPVIEDKELYWDAPRIDP